MVTQRTSIIFILATLSAVPVQEASALVNSCNNGSLVETSGRTRRQSPEGAGNIGSTAPPRTIVSPCPEVLMNIGFNDIRDRWFGLISFAADESTTGVVLTIQLDKPAHLIGTSFGEVDTSDNIIHNMRDDKLKLAPGQLLAVRFFVKFDATSSEDPPIVKTINFNNRQICPAEEDPISETEPPSSAAPEITSTNPPPRTTSAPPDVVYQPATPMPTRSMPLRRLPGRSQGHTGNVQLYNVNGEFKLQSNASLLVLLLARPPQLPQEENSSQSQSDNLDVLLEQVFGKPPEVDGVVASQATVPQLLSTHTDDEPPFISNSVTSAGSPVFRELQTTAAAPPSPETTARTPDEDGRDVRRPQWPSPCPGVFSYLPSSSGSDTWYGRLALTSPEHLLGIRLDVELDKPSRILGAWLGEVTSMDEVRYSIWNPSAEIAPGETINVRMFAKYDPDEADPPRVRSIRFNGRQICPTYGRSV